MINTILETSLWREGALITGVSDLKKFALNVKKKRYSESTFYFLRGLSKVSILSLATFGMYKLYSPNYLPETHSSCPPLQEPTPTCHYGDPIESAWKEHYRRFNECAYTEKAAESVCLSYVQNFINNFSVHFKGKGRTWSDNDQIPGLAKQILIECRKAPSAFCDSIVNNLIDLSARNQPRKLEGEAKRCISEASEEEVKYCSQIIMGLAERNLDGMAKIVSRELKKASETGKLLASNLIYTFTEANKWKEVSLIVSKLLSSKDASVNSSIEIEKLLTGFLKYAKNTSYKNQPIEVKSLATTLAFELMKVYQSDLSDLKTLVQFSDGKEALKLCKQLNESYSEILPYFVNTLIESKSSQALSAINYLIQNQFDKNKDFIFKVLCKLEEHQTEIKQSNIEIFSELITDVLSSSFSDDEKIKAVFPLLKFFKNKHESITSSSWTLSKTIDESRRKMTTAIKAWSDLITLTNFTDEIYAFVEECHKMLNPNYALYEGWNNQTPNLNEDEIEVVFKNLTNLNLVRQIKTKNKGEIKEFLKSLFEKREEAIDVLVSRLINFVLNSSMNEQEQNDIKKTLWDLIQEEQLYASSHRKYKYLNDFERFSSIIPLFDFVLENQPESNSQKSLIHKQAFSTLGSFLKNIFYSQNQLNPSEINDEVKLICSGLRKIDIKSILKSDESDVREVLDTVSDFRSILDDEIVSILKKINNGLKDPINNFLQGRNRHQPI